MIEDAVVALVPVLQAAHDVVLRRAGFEAEEGVGEIVADGVELRWKVIRLRFALLPDLGRLRVVLVHVVRDRPQVVEELAVDRPALVLLPDGLADQRCPFELDGVLEREDALAAVDDVAQPLVSSRFSLAAGVVEANQRSSMPPRWAP